jgi:hypothetical protein
MSSGAPRGEFATHDGPGGKQMLAAARLGVFVGSRTAGAFLGRVAVRLLNDRYFLMVTAYGGDIPGLPRIESVGVEPDVPWRGARLGARAQICNSTGRSS